METLKAPYFENAVLSIFEPPETPEEHAALTAFGTLTAENRLAETRHLYAYYQDSCGSDDGANGYGTEMCKPANEQDIWQHISVYSACARMNPDDGLAYVMVSGNCAWETEHGLLMVWREGLILNKVGGYDDHVTNEYAYGDAALARVVYRSRSPDFTTHLTP